MRKNNLFKALWLITLLLCGAWSVNAQNSASISPNGGTNGYVCIPANATNEVFTFVLPTGINPATQSPYTINDFESITWSVLGGGITIPDNQSTIQSTITVASMTGTSYEPEKFNKYAMGKLRVAAVLKSELVEGCPGELIPSFRTFTAELEIRKSFNPTMEAIQNEIVGPKCVVAGKEVTYSVAPWVSMYDANRVGFDEYQWNGLEDVAANELYYSADESSVTFMPNTTAGGQTISVTLGACNTIPVSLILNAEPEDPYLTEHNIGGKWMDEICIPFGIDTYELTIANPQDGVEYTWEKLSGWYGALDSYVVQLDNKIILNVQNSDKFIRLRATSECSEKTFDLQIKRSFNNTSNRIVAVNFEDSDCLPKGQPITFKVQGDVNGNYQDVSNGILRTWSVDNWAINAGQATEPSISITTGAGEATISVQTAGCDNTEPPLERLFKIKPDVPTIKGANEAVIPDSKICLDAGDNTTQIVLTVTDDVNATGYEWELPDNWGGNQTTTLPSITITTDGITSGDVRVKALDNCSDEDDTFSAPVSIGFTPGKPAIEKITTCVNAGLGGFIEVRMTNYDPNLDPNDDYVWNIDAAYGSYNGIYTIDPQSPTECTFKINTTGKTGLLTVAVSAKNACGSGDDSDALQYDVNKNDLPYNAVENTPLFSSTSSYALQLGQSDLVWFQNHTFEWYYAGRGNVTDMANPYQTVNTLPQGLLTSGGEDFYLTVTNTANGCKTRKINEAASFQFRSAQITDTEATSVGYGSEKTGMTVSPNPTQGEITVTLGKDETANLFLVTTAGKLVKTWMSQPAISTLNISNIPDGNYFVVGYQGDKKFAKQIILNK
jgi:hypothetical protein